MMSASTKNNLHSNPDSVDPESDLPLKAPQNGEPKISRSLWPAILRVVLALVIIIGILLLIFILPSILQARSIQISQDFVDFALVTLLGMLVGFVEVVSRYQDAPFRTATTWPALFYMLVNGSVAAVALWMVRLFGWQFVPGEGNSEITRWTEVIVSGLGAMAIFRSSLFVIGKEDQEVSIGPNAILEILLNALDKEVDRFRGQERAKIVKDIMEFVHYDDAILDISVLSKALLQNLSADDNAKIDEVRKQIEIITDIDPDVRKYLLGLRIMDVVGEDVLRQAIGIRGLEHYKRSLRQRQIESQQKVEILSELSAVGESLKESYAVETPEPAEMVEPTPEPTDDQAEDEGIAPVG
jgi:hypothetical protein